MALIRRFPQLCKVTLIVNFGPRDHQHSLTPCNSSWRDIHCDESSQLYALAWSVTAEFEMEMERSPGWSVPVLRVMRGN
jgi:hypothetical protein